jgi:prepilin-type N-terminal cleavage/methylation domain-containing protein
VIHHLQRRVRREGGFTLIELMIVVNIVGILTMLALPSYLSLKNRATDNANKANLRNARVAINAFFQDNNASYAAMTMSSLLTYNPSLDPTKFTMNGVTATTYCIQSPQGTGARTWRLNGPTARYELNHC